jgi:ATP-dependent RNA helicase DeaD
MSDSLSAEVLDTISFRELGLPDNLLKLLDELGYQTPSPIQAQIIPEILAGRDVMGQAQTGTGKTAAFALPGLCLLKLDIRAPQILVLAPTRELATQVCEAYERYAQHLPQVRCVALCGGQEYRQQISQLHQGPQVVVGTPGRLMDHMRRGTLDLSHLQQVVLDEADEMLRMGFIDDVEWILQQAPKERQTALFSATMPKPIFQIAQQYLKDPVDIRIKTKAMTATTITQKYWMVAGATKIEALTRLLEVTPYTAAIVFVRTKTATVDIAEVLRARGFRVLALNGDIDQKLRQRSVDQLKSGEVDVLVATDVAARGLDVERISLVINFDIPFDPEAYVHRIGRTGRAGREGQAILFVAQR